VRRDKVKRVGGFEEGFRSVLQVTEDQVFNAKICLEAPVIVVQDFFERISNIHRSADIASFSTALVMDSLAL
jgi:hypothetical protein